MKKLISLIIFSTCLIWTWKVVHSSANVGFETHAAIQNKLAEIIVNALKEKRPNITEVRITRMWTEAETDRRLKAVFSYHFMEPDENGKGVVERTIEGEAYLHRVAPEGTPNETNSSPPVEDWTLMQIKTLSDNIYFSEPTVILGNGGSPSSKVKLPPPLQPEEVPRESEPNSESQKEKSIEKHLEKSDDTTTKSVDKSADKSTEDGDESKNLSEPKKSDEPEVKSTLPKNE